MKRFDIPDPVDVNFEESSIEEWRYHKEFRKPVQLRVLNVLKHWVEHHFYDFERDENLRKELFDFLEILKESSYNSMKKWVNSIKKIVMRKIGESLEKQPIIFTFQQSPPPIEWNISTPEEDWAMNGLLTVLY